MYINLIKSLIIGSILGIIIGVAQVDSSSIGLIVSLCACVVLGLATVMTIDEKPHIYAIFAILVSGLLLSAFYGLRQGAFYTAGVAGIYGTLSVQLFKAIFIASDNVRFLVNKSSKKK